MNASVVDDREIAGTIIRSVAAGAAVAGSATSNPVVKIVAKSTSAVLELLALLVEKVGRDKAEGILRELVANPAKPITAEQLAADVARIKAEFGIAD